MHSTRLPLPPRFHPIVTSVLVAWATFAPAWTPAATAAVEAPYRLIEPPKARRPLIRAGDRLAICGDSITEQRMYSRILETYLTVCTPELGIRVRQYGWSGERADGFFERQQNDVLRFTPTLATTCYGMNDHRYRPFEPWIGELYRLHLDAVVRSFQDAGARVVIGSPGTVGKVPHWVKDAGPTVDALNRNLAELRNLAARVAYDRSAGFADVFTAMWEADRAAHAKYGTNYAVPGKDGVHPDWAGQLVMAYAFLEGLGVSGDIGTITVNLRDDVATASEGHQVRSVRDGTVTLRSTRYPFCAAPADPARDNSIRSGMQWVPFQERLNRLRLVVKDAKAPQYTVTWGPQSRTYTGAALRKGVNLAADFEVNPFSEAFQKVDDAVAAKQAFETKQIKEEFHGAAGKSNMDATVQRTEAEREPLAAAIRAAVVPVEHALRIEARTGATR
jgi:lysophospholipase L1-like esterase